MTFLLLVCGLCELKLLQLAPWSDKHHICFFWNVKWKEMILKTFQGRAVGGLSVWSEVLSSMC